MNIHHFRIFVTVLSMLWVLFLTSSDMIWAAEMTATTTIDKVFAKQYYQSMLSLYGSELYSPSSAASTNEDNFAVLWNALLYRLAEINITAIGNTTNSNLPFVAFSTLSSGQYQILAAMDSTAPSSTTSTDTSLVKPKPDSIAATNYIAPSTSALGAPEIPREELIYQSPSFGRSPFVSSKKPSIFTKVPSGLEVLRSIDTTGSLMITTERILGTNIGTPKALPLDVYASQRKNEIRQQLWDSLSYQYDLKRALNGNQLAKLLGQSANLAIPLPPNPLTTIFGKPELSINVNGEALVRGGWRWDSQNTGAASAFGQTQSTPIFQQDININVSARIGDKLRLGTDWSTRRQFEFENRFRIGFDGYDDDIIKRVELGNVQFQIPQSQYMSPSQALFGARLDMQFGPLFIKTVASQRRGERKFVNISGGGSNRTRFVLRAYDYAQNHFFVDTLYKSFYRRFWSTSPPVVVPVGRHLIKDLEVYESSGDVRDQALAGLEVVAYDTLHPIRYDLGERYPSSRKSTSQVVQGRVERGRFLRLDPTRYAYDQNLGEVMILSMRQDRTYAVAYKTEGATASAEDDEFHGTMSINSKDRDTLVLKLLYRPNLQPNFVNLWARQMRNYYPVNSTNVSLQDAKINLYYLRTNNDSTDVLEGTGEKIVTALRVDRVNNGTGVTPPDGVFDILGSGIQNPGAASGTNNPTPPFGGNASNPGNLQTRGNLSQQRLVGGSPFFDAQRGEIIFPSLEPFREGIDIAFAARNNPAAAQQFYFSSIYDSQVNLARLQAAQDRWLITGEVQGMQAAGRISLGFNIAPNTVRVRLDGRELRENDDYTVDYSSGTLTMRNPQAQNPGANLNVEFEQNDVMNTVTKTLLGVRADMDIYKSRSVKASLGGTFMNYRMAALIDRVRVNEEPVSNSMFGFDGRLDWQADWLTSSLNALPFFTTKEKSNITLRGEWATMLPTPNRRVSEIPEDNGNAVAYIDDFEGAQRYISLGMQGSQWSHSSPPVDSTITAVDSMLNQHRGRMHWFQRFVPWVDIREVYPNRNTVQGRTKIAPLEMVFNPYFRGIHNRNPEYIDSLNPAWDSVKSDAWQQRQENKSRIWGGTQRLLSSFTSNFDVENVDFIEIMMRIPFKEAGAKMYIDLGQISEDVINNSLLNTEDGFTSASPIANGRIDPGEDIGIDQIDNATERIQYPYPLNREDDPARDDYFFNFSASSGTQGESDFLRFNNYEGNSTQSEIGQFPDTEILNRQNGQSLALDNSYFQYEVNIDQIDGNPQIVGGANGWYLYRIPLRGAKRAVGNPSFANVQYVRTWFKGGAIKVDIAEWRFSGAQWQRFNYAQIPNSAEITDNTLRVAFVNREENSDRPDFYTMPPGVSPPRNLANPDFQNDILLNEQSLSLAVTNLSCGDERAATRYFRPQDWFFYRQVKFFVKGVGGSDFVPPAPSTLSPADTNAPQFFIRFGIDSANYYEYRAPLTSSWRGVGINFQDLTALKTLRDSLGAFIRGTYPVPGEPLARFAILGNPILTRIQFVSFGIANPSGRCPKSLSTTMWIDELRLIEPDSKSDWAATIGADIKLADLGTIVFNYQRVNPFFHRLEERFGNRMESENYNININAGFEKFLPKSWKEARIPFTFSRTERNETPRFVAQNDVNLESAAQLAYARAIELGASQEQAQLEADNVRRRSNSRVAQQQYAINGFKFGIPSEKWYIRETINRLALGFAYSQESEQSQTVRERFTWQWRFSANYSVSIPASTGQVAAGELLKDIPILSGLKDWKINFLPQQITLTSTLNRRRRTEQSWFLSFPTPVERSFDAANTLGFTWKLTENGLFSPTITYQANSGSTLVPLELDSLQRQRSGAAIAQQMFFNEQIVNMGTPSLFTQTFQLTLQPKLPNIFGLQKNIEFQQVTFTSNYSWRDPLQPDPLLRDASKTAMVNNQIRTGANIRLRQLSNVWFGEAKGDTSGSVISAIIRGIRSVFFDYDQFTMNFNQTNDNITPGVMGGNGFSNIFGRLATFRSGENVLGPSAAYMLGLVQNPHGSIRLRGSGAFPFIGFEEDPGLRPANGQFQDNFRQRTSLNMTTSRPLWKGATLDLQWRTEFGTNRNQLTTTDAEGRPSASNLVLIESYSRSFLTLPPFLMFSAFNNTPQNVVDRYRQNKRTLLGNRNEDSLNTSEQIALQNIMTNSFIGGLQAFEFFPNLLSRILPQVNWTLRWEGIEKVWFFNNFLSAARLEHAYTSLYSENARITDNGRIVEGQTVGMNFSPLIGINMTFDEKKVNGVLTTVLRYNTRTNYALATAARTLSQENASEFELTANYLLKGFSFPLMGLELKNDLEFSFNARYTKNTRATFSLSENAPANNTNGNEVDGNTQIRIEPRVRYTMSNRVTASAFFRYNGQFSTGASTPGFSTTEAGIEVRLALSGGR